MSENLARMLIYIACAECSGISVRTRKIQHSAMFQYSRLVPNLFVLHTTYH